MTDWNLTPIHWRRATRQHPSTSTVFEFPSPLACRQGRQLAELQRKLSIACRFQSITTQLLQLDPATPPSVSSSKAFAVLPFRTSSTDFETICRSSSSIVQTLIYQSRQRQKRPHPSRSHRQGPQSSPERRRPSFCTYPSCSSGSKVILLSVWTSVHLQKSSLSSLQSDRVHLPSSLATVLHTGRSVWHRGYLVQIRVLLFIIHVNGNYLSQRRLSAYLFLHLLPFQTNHETACQQSSKDSRSRHHCNLFQWPCYLINQLLHELFSTCDQLPALQANHGNAPLRIGLVVCIIPIASLVH